MASQEPHLPRPAGSSEPPLRHAGVTEESFRLLVATVTDYGIFLLDPKGIIRSWNPGAQRMKGYSAHETVGRHFSMFYTDEDRAREHPQRELEIAERVGRYEEEGWRVRKDGSRFWANIVITRLVGPDGSTLGFGKVTRDLTERKAAEDKLREANENLERRVAERTSELLEAVRVRDEFLSIASHELRTPLAPLKMQAQGILKYLQKGRLNEITPEILERMADTMNRSLGRLVRLIDNLLDVARISAGKIEIHPEEFDAAEVICETVARFQPDAQQAGASLDCDVKGPLPMRLDRLRLEQVLANLVSNAIRYGNGSPVAVSAAAHESRLVLRVKDRGIGIAPADLERIFDRFEQVGDKAGTGGLGLGLYIIRQVVEAQDGTIEVESTPAAGTTFTVKLPLHAAG